MLIGFVVGFIAASALVAALMPKLMLQTKLSPLGFTETVEMIQKGIADAGWGNTGNLNMNEMLKNKGVELERKVHIVQLCQPNYAKKVLEDEPKVSCLMPCAIGIYAKGDKVYVSKMNTGLMGKLFGGVVAEVMGKQVAADEKKILSFIR